MNIIETRRHQMFPVLDAGQIETAKRFASGRRTGFRARRDRVRRRRAECARLARAQGLDRGGAARRPRSRDADHNAWRRPVLRRGQPARRPGDARLRPGRRGGLHGAAVRCGPSARADDRLGRDRRDRDAGLHPAPRRADRGGRGSGSVLVGVPGAARPRAAAGLSPPQRLSLHRARRRERRGRPRRGRAPRRAAGGAAADDLPQRHGAEAADRRRGRRSASASRPSSTRRRSTTWPWSARDRPGSPPRSTPRRRVCRCWCSTSAPSAARPARRRGSRTISASRPASPAWRLPGAPSTRR